MTLTNKTLDNISTYFGWIGIVVETEYENVEDQKNHIVEATINEMSLREIEEAIVGGSDKTKHLAERYEKSINELQNEPSMKKIIDNYELTIKELKSLCVWTDVSLREQFKDIKDDSEKDDAISKEFLSTLEFFVVKYKFSLEITLNSFNRILLEEIKRL